MNYISRHPLEHLHNSVHLYIFFCTGQRANVVLILMFHWPLSSDLSDAMRHHVNHSLTAAFEPPLVKPPSLSLFPARLLQIDIISPLSSSFPFSLFTSLHARLPFWWPTWRRKHHFKQLKTNRPRRQPLYYFRTSGMSQGQHESYNYSSGGVHMYCIRVYLCTWKNIQISVDTVM